MGKGWIVIAYLSLFGVMLICPAYISAQEDTTATGVEEQLEKAFEELDTEEAGEAGEQLTQFLEDLSANPVNINSGGLDDLLQVPGINLKIARAIIDFRKAKPFEEKRELLEVRGVGEATYQRMAPYVTIGGAESQFRDLYLRPEYWMANRKVEVFSRYQQNLQTREGFREPDSAGGYLGSPAKYYQRFRITSNHLSINLTQEKDPGETLQGITGFDYNSGHIALTDNGKLKDFVVGDYSLSFGQGLVLWTGGAFGKGREVIGTISKNERGVKAYSSAQETDFFRGVAATYGETLELTTFYSNRPRTASVINGDTTRFPSSAGFHRTESELERKNNIDQMVVGGRARLDTPIGLLGVSGYYNEFTSYIAKGTSLSNLYDFEGSENSVVGVDYRGLAGSAFVFGEIARSQNGGLGAVAGLEAPIAENTELALSYRNYQRDFQSFLSSGFGELSSAPQNEEGFYVGIRHQLTQKISLSGYVDQYRFAAPRFATSQATGGFDMLGLVDVKFTPKLNVYVLLRNELQDEEFEITNERGAKELHLGKEKRASIRANFEYQVSTAVRLRSRVEFARNKEAGDSWEKGFLMYQDVRLQPTDGLRIDARVSVFDTESFSTRVYQFESDLLYVLSNTVLYDRGQRAYVTVKYEVTEFMDLWFKYGITIFEDTQVIGSGLGKVEGSVRNSLGLQVRLQF
ncbi:ComEA family DNA-binding protein [Gracilimonas sediminicola]|uniref:Helix-hairpin-helix domain-containing protein n=1 Tax=Gracilimonas sediminicola TaxID=2952158 RepID=A0A9X2RBS4_9BACT|nr:helix-hairpin-helix domain-containing protein [Gracilimonas sediminicola]MCP9290515.1 helix-hairpin-helix domain-containing protein [Gracilimonas sediminicola]